MGIKISELAPTASPSRGASVPVALDGLSPRYTVEQILGLAMASDATFNPATGGGVLTATKVQAAIDELVSRALLDPGVFGETLVGSEDLPAALTALGLGSTIVDFQAASYTANADLSTVIPGDDTVPQSTEGTQILSLGITPKSTTNRLIAFFSGHGVHTTTDNGLICALFAGGASALAAREATPAGPNFRTPLTLLHSWVPGSTSLQTISIRVGAAAGTMRMNGNSSGRVLGGAQAAQLFVFEVRA